MQPFLLDVARQLIDNHRNEMEQVMVVFNNKRAGRFLQKHLSSFGGKPFFMPVITGIDDLVSMLGGQQIMPPEFLLFELYDIHQSMDGVKKTESFEEFMPLGEMMIRDFTEIDLYRVDAEKIFDNLHELKKIGEWDISGVKPTDFQLQYLNFYRSLFKYYTLLRESLAKEGRAYTGMAYRHVAENIDTLAPKLQFKNIYFVGFNALSACELTIMDWFVKQGIGKVIFDGDDYYFKDPNQEAGLFLREHVKRFPTSNTKSGILLPSETGFGDNFSLGIKKIHIINCPENVLQAKAAGQIIGEILKNENKKQNENHNENDGTQAALLADSENLLEDTAIVLADESLLLPMLNSLPKDAGAVNITMGYPFKLSIVHGLACLLLSLYTHTRNSKFYHSDVVNLLSDNLLSNCFSVDNIHSILTQQFSKEKTIYISGSDLLQILKPYNDGHAIDFIFDNATPSIEEILDIMLRTASLIATSKVTDGNNIEIEALACFIQIVDYFKELHGRRGFVNNADTLLHIYQRIAQRRTIPFKGEPLQGLQLLGVLETRSLDFKRIVMLSVNEGTLPVGRKENSLIPLSLKRDNRGQKVVIPGFEEKDAVYAYHFYRMLQRAEEVWLLYSSDAEGMGKGEPSRFLLQIQTELAKRYGNIQIDNEVMSTTIQQSTSSTAFSITKDDNIMKRLKALSSDGFSPTMLNRYRNCPMQFYFMNVLGAKEQADVSEELEANELGTFIHDTLEHIYNIDKDKHIRQETLENELKKLDVYIKEKFKKEALKGRSDEGKNHLYEEVAKLQISHFLRKEINYLKKHTIEMVLTEKEMTQELEIPELGIKVIIQGKADRVDKRDGLLYISDYKSGKATPSELSVKKLDVAPRDVPDKWFQVMTYAWLYCRSFNHNDKFKCGVIPLRMLSSDFMPASWNSNDELDGGIIEDFGENVLKPLVYEIMNPSSTFEATPSKNSCDYCPFVDSCIPKDKK